MGEHGRHGNKNPAEHAGDISAYYACQHASFQAKIHSFVGADQHADRNA